MSVDSSLSPQVDFMHDGRLQVVGGYSWVPGSFIHPHSSKQRTDGDTDPSLHPHRKHSETKVEKKALLKLLRDKLGNDITASELDEPLEYSHRSKTSAVLVVTSPIDINGIKVTKLAAKILLKHTDLSLDSLSHWALVVVDRGDGVSYLYDLMSDREQSPAPLDRFFLCVRHFRTNIRRAGHVTRDAADYQDHEKLPKMFPSDGGDDQLLDDSVLHWRDNQIA